MEQPPEDRDAQDGGRLIPDDFASLTGFARRQAHMVESRLLYGLKRRLEQLDEPAADTGADPAGDPGGRLRQLLQASLEQRRGDAEHQLLQRLVADLHCDEARIIAALSDGAPTPACHVAAASLVGRTPVIVLDNASRIGTEAGIMLGEQVPVYIRRLRADGLLTAGPEDRALGERYGILESETMVREAVQHIEEELRLRARIQRFTLRLSPLGQRLWALGEQADIR